MKTRNTYLKSIGQGLLSRWDPRLGGWVQRSLGRRSIPVVRGPSCKVVVSIAVVLKKGTISVRNSAKGYVTRGSIAMSKSLVDLVAIIMWREGIVAAVEAIRPPGRTPKGDGVRRHRNSTENASD